MRRKLATWIIVAILCISLVNALGLRPAKTNIASDEINKYDGAITIVNTESKNSVISIEVKGEMSEYVNLSRNAFIFQEGDDLKVVGFTINLPEAVPPGTSCAEIVIEEDASDFAENAVSSKIVLKHKISIHGPYPDKFINVKLNFMEAGDQVELISEIKNLGKKNLQTVQTTFKVTDSDLAAIQFHTDEVPLKLKENKVLKTKVPISNFGEGEFAITAVTTFDGEQVEHNKKLIIGRPEIDIAYFNEFFIANEINEYTLGLLNQWNKDIENVFVDVSIKKNNEEIEKFRTPPTNIQALNTRIINDYFDAKEVNPGTYTFDMVINFWNEFKMDKKSLTRPFVKKEDIKTSVGTAILTETIVRNKSAVKIPIAEPLKQTSFWKYFAVLINFALLALILFLYKKLKNKRNQ